MDNTFREQELPMMQRMAAKSLTESYQSIVQVTVTAEAKADALQDYVARLHHRDSTRISFTSVLVGLLAKTLSSHPAMNVSYSQGRIRCYQDINIGLAVAAEDGSLSVPVVHKADQKAMEAIDRDCREIRALALEKKLRREHLVGASITLSNVGAYPSIRFNTPLVPVGQGAIIGIGAMHERALIGSSQAQTILPLSLSFDHRVINGLPASAFLQGFVDRIENPD